MTDPRVGTKGKFPPFEDIIELTDESVTIKSMMDDSTKVIWCVTCITRQKILIAVDPQRSFVHGQELPVANYPDHKPHHAQR